MERLEGKIRKLKYSKITVWQRPHCPRVIYIVADIVSKFPGLIGGVQDIEHTT